jgi:NAD(P)-dependent dehydrogenase (short-subunit alcohol dehydrogenase family)
MHAIFNSPGKMNLMNQMKGKIVLVTGSTNGIGKQTAIELAASGATVLIHARSFSEGTPVLELLRKDLPGASFDLFIADFEVQNEIDRMAAEIKSTYNRLDVLVNNAAVHMEERKLTVDTIEKTFSVNHLAPFLLTHLLLPLLKNSISPRIINVSSHAHYVAQFNIQNIQGEKSFNGIKVYCCSKLCNLLFTYALAEKLRNQNIVVNAVHPGMIRTGTDRKLFGECAGGTVEDGADTIAFLACSEEIKNVSGMYFMSRLPVQSSYHSYNKIYQRQLWKLSEQLTMIYNYDPAWAKHTIPFVTRLRADIIKIARFIIGKMKTKIAPARKATPFYYQKNARTL